MCPTEGRPSPEQVVVQAFRAGVPVEDIARRSGCSPALVARVLGEAGLMDPRRGRRWPYDATVERHIAIAYAAGATMAQLVSRFGGSNRALHQVLEHHGVPIRQSGRRPSA